MSQIEQQFKQAVIALQNGQPEKAKRVLEKLSKKVKDSSAIWYNLGLANQFLEKHSSAVPCYEKVIKLSPDNDEARINLVISLTELGQFDTALKHLSKIEVENHPRALNIKATILAQTGDFEKAQVLFEQAFSLDNQNADIRFNLANNLRSLEKPDQALELLKPLLEQPLPSIAQRCLYAELLLDLKQYESASQVIKVLHEQYPNEYDVLKLHLQMFEIAKSYQDIIEAANSLLKQNRQDAATWNSLAGAYFQLDNMQEAKKAYDAALKIDPENPEYWSNVGLVYSSLGDKENAEACYRKSLAIRPRHPEPYRSLSSMKRYKDVNDEDIQVMQSMWDDAQLDSGHRMKLAFALGKAYDDCALYDKAFSIYARGNELKFAEIETDFDAFYAHIDRMLSVFTQPMQYQSQRSFDKQPIYIVGMPRSGTTLSEQILSRHPKVTGCGELPCIEKAVSSIELDKETPRVYPDDFSHLPADILSEKSNDIMAYIQQYYQVDTPYFIDKMPTNFMHVPFIKALFPKAKIVNCRRHPLDVIVSNYFQIFGSDLNFVYNLETLAKYYIRYYKMSAQWKRLFGEDFYENDYEALVTNHEQEARNLVEAVGLNWDAKCLDDKHSRDTVTTASIWQVREGVYTRSKARWRHYETHLQPAIEILRQANILNNHLEPCY